MIEVRRTLNKRPRYIGAFLFNKTLLPDFYHLLSPPKEMFLLMRCLVFVKIGLVILEERSDEESQGGVVDLSESCYGK